MVVVVAMAVEVAVAVVEMDIMEAVVVEEAMVEMCRREQYCNRK